MDEFSVRVYQFAPNRNDPAVSRDVGIELGDRIILESVGVINRAIERDLLSFRTGDWTFAMRNDDGFLDEVFSPLGADERWHLLLTRNGQTMFRGVVLGQGSVTFDRYELTCEVTAYGPLRVLEDTSAEAVARVFPTNVLSGLLTIGQRVLIATGGAQLSQLGILPQDRVHVTDHGVKNETIKLLAKETENVTGSSWILEAPWSAGFPIGTPLEFLDNGYRFKTVEFLIGELLREANIRLAEYNVSGEAFGLPAPAHTNRPPIPAEGTTGNTSLCWFQPMIAKVGTKVYIAVGSRGSSTIEDGQFSQPVSDSSSNWTKEVSSPNHLPYIDWSRYRTLTEGDPSYPLLPPASSDAFGNVDATTAFPGVLWWAFKFSSGTSSTWRLQKSAGNLILTRADTADGITWGGTTTLATIGATGATETNRVYDAEYDPGRDQVWVTYIDSVLGKHTRIWDVVGGAFVGGFDLTTGAVMGLCYVKEWDAIVGVVNNKASVTDNANGPWSMVAYRGTVKLWERSIPTFAVASERVENRSSGTINILQPTYPTKTLRVFDGVAHMLMLRDSSVKMLLSEDEFQTYMIETVSKNATITYMIGGTDGTNYRFCAFSGTSPTVYGIAGKLTQGTVEYADFDGKSVAEAVLDLAALINAVVYIDDEWAAHVVSRELFDENTVQNIDSLVKEREDVEVWDQVRQFVKVSGGGAEGEFGTKDFEADPISITSDYVPSNMYALVLARSFHDFFSRKRRMSDVRVQDTGRIYQPLHRVTMDGSRWMVYESDHDLAGYEVALRLVEDVD